MKKITRVKLILMMAIAAGSYAQGPDTLRLLFIGNSHTYYNNLPWLVDSLAMSAGRKAIVDMSTYGGYRLEQHRADSQTIYKVNHGPWDFVILQEQSQIPCIPYWRYNSMYPACWSFDTLIRNNGATTALFMTWGWKYGGQMEYNGYYSIVFQDFFEMQDTVAAAYEWIAQDIVRDTLVPVGRAWRRAKTLDSLVDLWQPDNYHPTLKGSYLTACVFYTKLFQANPIGLPYTAGLSLEDALFLQTVAYETIYGIAETGPEIPIPAGITVYPNPFAARTDIRWEITDNSSRIVKLQLFDISGRLVKAFPLTDIGHPSSVIWRGEDNAGRSVPPGIYFIQLQAGEKTETAKIVRLK
jgi:hypothetical protein